MSASVRLPGMICGLPATLTRCEPTRNSGDVDDARPLTSPRTDAVPAAGALMSTLFANNWPLSLTASIETLAPFCRSAKAAGAEFLR